MGYQWDINGIAKDDVTEGIRRKTRLIRDSGTLDIRAGLFTGILGIYAKAVVQLLPGSLFPRHSTRLHQFGASLRAALGS